MMHLHFERGAPRWARLSEDGQAIESIADVVRDLPPGEYHATLVSTEPPRECPNRIAITLTVTPAPRTEGR